MAPANLMRLFRGSAAEHLVCADLLLRGYSASIAAHGMPYDVLVEVDGLVLRVEVKSSQFVKTVTRKHRSDVRVYEFSFGKSANERGYRRHAPGQFDLAAIVATDLRVIGYLPASLAKTSVHVAAPGQERTCRRAWEELTLDAALAAVKAAA